MTCLYRLVLALAPNDEDAMQIKVVAMLQGSKPNYGEIAKLLEKTQLLHKLSFEYTYALYKDRQNDKCLQALAGIADNKKDERIRHIEAQLFYRVGEFDKAVSVYKNTFSMEQLASDLELRTNVLAAYVAASKIDDAISLSNMEVVAKTKQASSDGEESEDEEDETDTSYELSYNAACAYIEAGDMNAAYSKLEASLECCRAVLADDDYTEQESNNELAPLLAQMAYVLQLQGQTAKAEDLYRQVIDNKPSDKAVVAIASNNILTVRADKKEEKYFHSLNTLNRAVGAQGDEKTADAPTLSNKQRFAIQCNRAILMLQGKKVEKCRVLAEELASSVPHHEYPKLLMACCYFKEKNYEKSLQTLKSVIDSANLQSLSINSNNSPVVNFNLGGSTPLSPSLNFFLALAQLSLMSSKGTDFAESFAILDNILDLCPALAHQPAVVATYVALYERQGAFEKAVAAFTRAVDYWKQASSSGSDKQSKEKALVHLDTLLGKSAAFCMKHGHYEQAVSLYQSLIAHHRSRNDDANKCRVYLSKLVIASSNIDASKAVEFASELPPPPGVSDIDVDALIAAAPMRETRPKRKASVVQDQDQGMDTSADIEVAARQQKKQRKRKPRYPKNYDPNNPGTVDPERWLPKYERTTIRVGKRKKKQNNTVVIKGGQGASVVDESLDRAAAAASGVAATDAKTAAPAPKKIPSKNKNKRKKKRGRR